MTSSDLWDEETAERYDESSADMFAPEVLDPTVDLLAGSPATDRPSSSRSAPAASRSRWPRAASR